MNTFPSMQYICSGLALLFAWDDQRNGVAYRHFAIVTVDGLQNQDLKALGVVSVSETDPEDGIVSRVMDLAAEQGVTVTEDEIDWACHRLDGALLGS